MQRGFSLVEVSIVLSLLGLLVGGVLGGQALIRASELRSVSTEYKRYQTAIETFRDTYRGLPGDITNAQSYWGAAGACPGTATQGTPVATCNGNGNRLIDFPSEPLRAWQQLANAVLIEGSYNGVTADNGYPLSVAATNSPRSKLANAIWLVLSEDNRTGTSNGQFFHYYFTQRLFIGGPVTGNWPYSPVLTPTEAWNLDTKMDDGKPGTGIITGRVGNNCTPAATGADFTVDYTLSESGLTCFLNLNF